MIVLDIPEGVTANVSYFHEDSQGSSALKEEVTGPAQIIVLRPPVESWEALDSTGITRRTAGPLGPNPHRATEDAD